jgi:TRAP transporter TAXI family solute receptor
MQRRIFLTALIFAPFANVALGSKDRRYVVATASSGGTFHPVGVALSALVQAVLQKPYGISLTAATTAGSTQNIRLLKSGEAQFAILQGLIGLDARQGSGAFSNDGADRTIRALTALWPNVEQFVVRSEARKTGTIDDLLALKRERVALGDRGSGTLASCRTLLSNLGVDIERDFELLYMGYGPAGDALQRGDVLAIALPAGLPTKSLARLKAAMGMGAAILGFSPAQARRADGGRNLWLPYRIPADTYPAQKAEIQTIAQPNFLAARGDVPEEDAYLVTRTIFENLSVLHAMHDATRAIALDGALSGLPMPLHPGAIRYFQEKKVAIPEHLMVK